LIRLQTLITSIFLLVILGSNEKLDLEKEIEPESDMILDGADDLAAVVADQDGPRAPAGAHQ